MKRESIFFTIIVSFLISFILVVGSYLVIITQDYKQREFYLLEKYQPITKMVLRQQHRFGIDKKFIENLDSLNFKLFLNMNEINAITYNPKTKVLLEKKFRNNYYRILNLNSKNYIYLKRRGDTFLVEDKSEKTHNSQLYITLVFIAILIALILSFLATIRKLYPLKILKDKVKTLGDENFDFECCDSSRQDEVSLLAKEFKNSASKLKNLKEARNIFIRNIMHELKTPITKGKFLMELERNSTNDEKLKEVFSRLELLINEFASIEELISSTKNIDKSVYYLDDLIDNAIDILMIDDDKVEKKYENKKLNVNFKLFSVAMKNLIDNALKYSPLKKVYIKTEDENIIFENEGEELKNELQSYYEPFSNKNVNSNNSFGLGLYIVYNILKANSYYLEYEYKDGKNIFKCIKDDESIK